MKYKIIFTEQPTRRLLIMIVSVVWIPPVILYAIYYFYKLYQKRGIYCNEYDLLISSFHLISTLNI